MKHSSWSKKRGMQSVSFEIWAVFFSPLAVAENEFRMPMRLKITYLNNACSIDMDEFSSAGSFAAV